MIERRDRLRAKMDRLIGRRKPSEAEEIVEPEVVDDPSLPPDPTRAYDRLERRLRGMERREPDLVRVERADPTRIFWDLTGWDFPLEGPGVVEDPRGRNNPPLPPPERESFGEYSVLTTRFPLDFQHGTWRLREVLRRAGDPLDRLAESELATSFDWRDAAFLDTETTSLSTGSGVYVFMTGVGAFEGEEFVVRQYLMHSPDGEDGCMQLLSDDLQRRERVVTFFGKAFDQHRLLDRARFLGLELHFPRDHYDLYWMSRRLVGGRFPDGKLRTMEQRLLEYFRLHDLPGSEAPDAFFRALRGEGDDRLRGVALHNLIDVVSLASLAAELTLRWEQPAEREDRIARGRVWARAGFSREALEDLDACRRTHSSPEDHLEVAGLLRKCEEFDRQGIVLEEACAAHPDCAPLWIELAKWCEHRQRDLERALDHARRALDCGCDDEGAVQHRIARLERRLSRSGPETTP